MIQSLCASRSNAGAFLGVPEEALSLYKQALVLIELQDYAEAARILNRAAVLEPNEPEIFDKLGVCYLGIKNYNQAISSHTKAISLDPQCGFYYFERALVYFAIGNQGAMISDLIAGARLGDPHCQVTLTKLGVTW